MIPVGQRQRVKALLKGLSIAELDELALHLSREIAKAKVNLHAQATGRQFGPKARHERKVMSARLRDMRDQPIPVTLARLAKLDNKEDKE